MPSREALLHIGWCRLWFGRGRNAHADRGILHPAHARTIPASSRMAVSRIFQSTASGSIVLICSRSTKTIGETFQPQGGRFELCVHIKWIRLNVPLPSRHSLKRPTSRKLPARSPLCIKLIRSIIFSIPPVAPRRGHRVRNPFASILLAALLKKSSDHKCRFCKEFQRQPWKTPSIKAILACFLLGLIRDERNLLD